MNLSVHSNILMMNTNRQLNINTGMKSKGMEKLASGYRINRAADDAAGLAISEKMRRQIRGLDQGTFNAQDGISWVQIGDGSLNEVHDMLHRMQELTVKSLNGSYSDRDRAMMEDEFEQLQCEIDRITKGTEFNSQDIFDEHETPYYQFEGNMKWLHQQPHVITNGNNNLIVEYRRKEGDAPKKAEITVPAGEYTTQELIDEIDSALFAAGLRDEGLAMEYTQQGTCNMNLEGGAVIDEVAGGLSYLLYDSYDGGSLGALIGTTIFPTEQSQLLISKGNNDNLSFLIEGASGSSTKSITIPPGLYTRSELIDILNKELQGTTVTASKYGTGIKLASNDSIISGFKGNMFKIDEGSEIYTSVFYDNVKYGSITMHEGYFLGGQVMPTDPRDAEHKYFEITKANQILTLAPNIGNEVELTIPEGSYDIFSMVNVLNDLFGKKNLELVASVYPDYGNPAYHGIKISSTIKGQYSKVGINEGKSSAYETLFVRHPYTEYHNDAKIEHETVSDVTTYTYGSKFLSGTAVPLKIVAGQNDSFTLSLTDTNGSTSSFTITLKAGEYKDANEICAEIDDKLNGANAPVGYQGKLKVSVYNNRIMLQETGKELTGIQISAVTNNDGYKDIWVTASEDVQHNVASDSGTSSRPASITLNTPVKEPVEIDGSNNKLGVTVDGVTLTVTLPTGKLSYQKIIDEINKQLVAGSGTTNITFPDVGAYGTEKDQNFVLKSTGITTIHHASYQNTGSVEGAQQGTAGSSVNIPAKITISGAAIPEKTVIDNTNKYFQFQLNGNMIIVNLSEREYSRNELLAELQNKINAATNGIAPDEFGGVKVSYDSGNHLVLTAGIKRTGGKGEHLGSETSISCGTGGSSFLSDLHSEKSTVSITSTKPLQPSIQIDGSNNRFSFNMIENGVGKGVDITLPAGTYSRQTLVDEINRQLAGKKASVTASLSGNCLQLTADGKGTGNQLIYDSGAGGNSASALFGQLVEKGPAKITLNQNIKQPIVIGPTTDELSVKVGNSFHTIKLDQRQYATRQDLINEINKKFQANGIGLKASLEGNKIHYETTEKGHNAYVFASYGTGGSSMKAIYGQTAYQYEGVTASFDASGKLVLTRIKNGGKLEVSSEVGSVFQLPTITETIGSTYGRTGWHSNKHAYINGVGLNSPVKIDKWNKEMSFCFWDEGQARNVQIQLQEKEYTFQELQEALQKKIDQDVAGANKLTVTVTNKGVRIEAVNTGSTNYMDTFTGGFYDKVMCSFQELVKESKPEDHIGSQSNDTAYVVGRKDVKNVATKIQERVNDSLSLDFTYGGKTEKITMTLDAGTYDGEALRKHIQKKLNEQLKNLGLPEGLIEVGLGNINTGITGANDRNALNFRLSSTAILPTDGNYLIDGVSGTAAFSVFYQTDGDIAVPYVKGGKDISGGTEIKNGESEFSFETDGVTYKIDIPPGTYTQQGIVKEINNLLKASGAPVVAVAEDGNLKLQHTKYGQHKISNLSGPAKKDLFFVENGEDKEKEGVLIQCSGESEDYVVIDRPVLNTVSMGINSITISKSRYARKAIDRLNVALVKISTVRGYFGAMQNRLGHTVDNNGNRSENTSAAESRIRDTDMARQLMAHSNLSILQNAGQAFMSQTKAQAQEVLNLLR